jgi:hypothetical protein
MVFNSDQSVCVVKEKYSDSDARMGNLGDVLVDLLATCDMEAEVYGNPSDELRTAVEGLNVRYSTQFSGL